MKVMIPMIELPDETDNNQPIWEAIMYFKSLERDEKRWKAYQKLLAQPKGVVKAAVETSPKEAAKEAEKLS